MVKDYSKKFLETNLLVQQKINIIKTWVEKHGQIWSRRVLYELVSKQLVKDTSDASYQATCKLFQNLREYEMIPYTWFEDKRTTIHNVGILDYGNFQTRFNNLCAYYSRTSKALQSYYMEMWTEKKLSEDTTHLIDQYDIGLVMGEGFIGDIPLHDTKERIQRILEQYKLPIRIFYISDYDSEGEHTFNLCKTTLEPLGDVEVKKLFLTKDQVKKHNLISNLGYKKRMSKPSIIKSHLSKQYVKDFFNNNTDLEKGGIVQYELDQIDIELMKQTLSNTISRFIDTDIINNMEETCRKEVKKWLSKHYKK